ncbi:MAG TPA: hypothetical protein VF171_02450 [Trueperaceae bacterium]
MNRQMRRATEKSESKKEKDKVRQRRIRRQARVERTQRKTAKPRPKPAADKTPSRTGRRSGLLTAAVIALLVFKEIAPAFTAEDASQLTGVGAYVIDAAYFLFLGYFGCVWLLRRSAARAFEKTLVAGVVLAVLIEGAKYFLPQLTPDLISLALAVPAVVLGALLGRLVYRNS